MTNDRVPRPDEVIRNDDGTLIVGADAINEFMDNGDFGPGDADAAVAGLAAAQSHRRFARLCYVKSLTLVGSRNRAGVVPATFRLRVADPAALHRMDGELSCRVADGGVAPAVTVAAPLRFFDGKVWIDGSGPVCPAARKAWRGVAATLEMCGTGTFDPDGQTLSVGDAPVVAVQRPTGGRAVTDLVIDRRVHPEAYLRGAVLCMKKRWLYRDKDRMRIAAGDVALVDPANPDAPLAGGRGVLGPSQRTTSVPFHYVWHALGFPGPGA